MNNEILIMDFNEAIDYLVGMGKTRYAISKALGYKNTSTLCLYKKRSVKTQCGAEHALKMLNNYNILVKPYTSRAEIESIIEASR